MDITAKKHLLRELLEAKARELKRIQGKRSGAYVWLSQHLGVSLSTVQNWVNLERGWIGSPELEARLWTALGYRQTASGGIEKVSTAPPSGAEQGPGGGGRWGTPGAETEAAVEHIMVCLSRLRADQWEAFRRAARILAHERDQGGLKDGAKVEPTPTRETRK